MPRRKNSVVLAEAQKERGAMKRSIRKKCNDCMCGQKMDCEVPDCPLYGWKSYKGV